MTTPHQNQFSTISHHPPTHNESINNATSVPTLSQKSYFQVDLLHRAHLEPTVDYNLLIWSVGWSIDLNSGILIKHLIC